MPEQEIVEIKRGEGSMDLHICWSITNLCNYDCEYCPKTNSDGSQKWLLDKHAYTLIDKIYEHYVKNLGYKRIQISFTGGEPTLWKPFLDLCKYINKKGMTVGLTSNGSRKLDYWKELAPLVDWTCFSYHPEFVDDENVFELVSWMHEQKNVILPAVRLMMHPDKKLWDKCIQFGDRLRENLDNWIIECVELQNDFGEGIPNYEYNKKQQKYLKENGFEQVMNKPELVKLPRDQHYQITVFEDGTEKQLKTNDLVNKKLVNFFLWECDIGLESIYIDYFGNIFKAGCKEGGIIGRMQEVEEIQFSTSPVICSQTWCPCGTNIMVSKRKKFNTVNEKKISQLETTSIV